MLELVYNKIAVHSTYPFFLIFVIWFHLLLRNIHMFTCAQYKSAIYIYAYIYTAYIRFSCISTGFAAGKKPKQAEEKNGCVGWCL